MQSSTHSIHQTQSTGICTACVSTCHVRGVWFDGAWNPFGGSISDMRTWLGIHAEEGPAIGGAQVPCGQEAPRRSQRGSSPLRWLIFENVSFTGTQFRLGVNKERVRCEFMFKHRSFCVGLAPRHHKGPYLLLRSPQYATFKIGFL